MMPSIKCQPFQGSQTRRNREYAVAMTGKFVLYVRAISGNKFCKEVQAQGLLKKQHSYRHDHSGDENMLQDKSMWNTAL